MAAAHVTIAVTLFDGLHHLSHLLPALAQLDAPVAEVLVIDNGSTDGGPAWLGTHHPEVRLVALGENRGPSAARNRALEESRTDRVFLLDCDAVPAPDCLSQLMADLDRHPDAVIVQPRALFAHEPGRIHYDGARFSYTGLITLRNFGARVEDAPGESCPVDAVISMALLVDRPRLSAVQGLGDPFDEIYFIYFEDTDLSYRLRMAGRSLRVVPKAVVWHREGTAGVSYRAGRQVAYRRAFFLSRNRMLLLWKTYSARTFWLTLPAQLAYEVVLLAFLTVKRQPHAWLAGKLDLVRQRGAMRARRRATQALRVVADRDLLGFEGFSFIPLLRKGRAAHAVLALLNAGFGAYWRLVRWLL